jgi:hypothetical protein
MIHFGHTKNLTSVSVYTVSIKTGISVESLIEALNWSDHHISMYCGLLTKEELKFLANQYVKAVKNLQKRAISKKDNVAPSEINQIRKFLLSFVDFLFVDDSDPLSEILDSVKIERYFYDIIYDIDAGSHESKFSNFRLQLQFKKSLGLKLYKYSPGFVFRSNQYYIYPDEEEARFKSHSLNEPLFC